MLNNLIRQKVISKEPAKSLTVCFMNEPRSEISSMNIDGHSIDNPYTIVKHFK